MNVRHMLLVLVVKNDAIKLYLKRIDVDDNNTIDWNEIQDEKMFLHLFLYDECYYDKLKS